MQQYLKLFMVVVFAALSVALTSCGGDDDENGPKNPAENGTITVNGIACKDAGYSDGRISSDFVSYGASIGMTANLSLRSVNADPFSPYPLYEVYNMHFVYASITKGMTLEMRDIDSWHMSLITGPMETDTYRDYVSGSVTVEDLHDKTITLNIHNLTFANDEGQQSVVNGTIVCEYTIID